MISRAQIKQRARDSFRLEYWPCVGALVITVVIMAGAGMFSAIPIVGLAAPLLLIPIYVGACGFFLGVYRQDGDTNLGRLFNIAFSQNYGRKLGGMLWMELWIFLWSLIAIIPMLIGISFGLISVLSVSFDPRYYDYSMMAGQYAGMFFVIFILSFGGMVPAIIKSLSYSMTPFVLADCPEVPAKEALRISIRMTQGYKGAIFVMWLSFIGWNLLNAITCGIVGIFWVGPYMCASFAGLYEELKGRMGVANGYTPPVVDYTSSYNEPQPPQGSLDSQPTQL